VGLIEPALLADSVAATFTYLYRSPLRGAKTGNGDGLPSAQHAGVYGVRVALSAAFSENSRALA
jgi:hypothetical protein